MCLVKYLTVMFSVVWPVEKILFQPAEHDFHNSVSLNAFALQTTTNAMIVERSSEVLENFY